MIPELASAITCRETKIGQRTWTQRRTSVHLAPNAGADRLSRGSRHGEVRLVGQSIGKATGVGR